MTRLFELATYAVLLFFCGALIYKGVDYDTRYAKPSREFERRRKKGYV